MFGAFFGQKKWLILLGILCLTFGVILVKEGKTLGEEQARAVNGEGIIATKYKGKVAITFDDGPSETWTPQLLDGLKERKVKATFFLMGQYAEQCPEIVKRMKEEGHLIGNHTYHHVQLNKISKEEQINEVEATNQVIYDITGERPQFLRPPFGAWEKEMEADIDMIPVLWDVDPLDWCREDVGCIVETVVSHVKENDIILLHDRYPGSVTAAMQIIDILSERGYEFVTVEELMLE